MMDLAIATATGLGRADPDEAALLAAARDCGIDAQVLAWDDPAARFADARLTLIRSTWNYVDDPKAFLAWANALDNRLINPACVVRWNAHKRYLKELDDAGIPAVPTVLVPRGTRAPLDKLLGKKRWFRAVAKPAIGAGSIGARPVSASAADGAWFADAVDARDMLLQPFLSRVADAGEHAIVVVDGLATHAVRKAQRFAGDPEQVSPLATIADDERTFAEHAVRYVTRALPCGALLYARADLARDDDGRLVLMELELIEPRLFFAGNDAALARFVDGLAARLATLSVPRPLR